MGFLDNSGDIILDAVLTDTGRMRLAKGDGSFKITKFALSDDEINYGLYDKNHASGSAYYDIEVLQTPVLEAFTNNASSMKSKLISIPRTNLLYLPVLKLNTTLANYKFEEITGTSLSTYFVATDATTAELTTAGTTAGKLTKDYEGVLDGNEGGGSAIRIHQGLDTSDISPTFNLDPDLVENQYIVEIDNRLGMLTQAGATTTAPVSFIDDDNIASYFVSSSPFVSANSQAAPTPGGGTTTTGGDAEVLNGPRGTILQFGIKASLDLNSSTTLFTKLGSTFNIGSVSHYYIDTTVRVTGATTGYRLDIPVRFIKKV
jgi:hypothetical protein